MIEIGAGLGSLTLALAETGATVVAVEKDRDLVPVLTEVVSGHDVEVVEGDAALLDWSEVLSGAPTWRMVANLPYNVATPLVLDLLRDVPAIVSMLVMIQREAGERLAAGPGDGAVGIPSMIVAYHGTARVVGRVSASVFVPRPRVESVRVSIERRAVPPVSTPFEQIEPILRTAYGQRRKMLRRSLATLVDQPTFEAAGIDSSQRPQELSIEDWGRLAESRPKQS